MNIFKIIWNLAKIRSILESVYLFLNKINEPKDFQQIVNYVCIFQDGLENVLKIMGTDTSKLKEIKKEDIILASLVKDVNDDSDMA